MHGIGGRTQGFAILWDTKVGSGRLDGRQVISLVSDWRGPITEQI
jgi:hypothetical protein